LVEALLSDFYAPFATLRDQAAGFAVSLIKAGVRARGLPVGPVRAPLIDPTPEQMQQLESLLERGLHVAARANEFSEIA
jgi:5-dehydro-4-deoxyglucarate dehydratase